ncbi:MAG: flavin-dependent oxidoreductase [Mesorhizobium sp.]
MKVLIAGAGIGGLTLALCLHQLNPDVQVEIFEAAPEFRPLGLGINLMPHAIKVLSELGLQERLSEVAVEAKEFAFFTHNGQLVYREPTGLFAGYEFPHFSIHRADFHEILVTAVRERIGDEHLHLNHRLQGFDQDEGGVTLHFAEQGDGRPASQSGDVLIGCDGLHSVVRKAFYPDQGDPVFHGINMWRGVARMKPFLTGASATRIGALYRTSKLTVYPIRNDVDEAGSQLVNWVAEVVTDEQSPCDWSAAGKLEDFYPIFENWTFDWLDCAEMIRNSDMILSYPMADRDPVGRWTFGRVTLLGDAAHPMYPRGGNGAAQAIIDARTLARVLATMEDSEAALKEYEDIRLQPTSEIVLGNRSAPPDTIIELVEERTGGKAFQNIEDVISIEEISNISHNYQRLAGYDKQSVSQEA